MLARASERFGCWRFSTSPMQDRSRVNRSRHCVHPAGDIGRVSQQKRELPAIGLHRIWIVSDRDLCRLVQPSRLAISNVPQTRSIALDCSAADMLSKSASKFFRRTAMTRMRRMLRRVRAVAGFVRPRAWMTMTAGSAPNAWHRERRWQYTSINSGDVRRCACEIAGRLSRRTFW
ncbi:hypothetical protein EV131_12427 [Rhizobium laguerreae]|uniref:Uncharacterized protein n=1 Tax=Rhizobium laguerreae TaxID=1076926 RepID=A0AAX2QB00_9HYPH|nr:hypothetical protein EV131_12427 [Rhizobium laguerreae]